MKRLRRLDSARSKPTGHKRKKLVEKTFRDLGRRHLAEDFPNPTRQGCPPDDVLKLLAEKPAQVDDSVLDHITMCSPCYRVYSGFLQKTKAKQSNRTTRTPSKDRR